MTKEVTQCRVCGNRNLIPVIDLGNQRLSGVFPHPGGQAPSRSPLQLIRCQVEGGGEACGLVQLAHQADLAEMYGSTYGYYSSLSPTMTTHLHELVDGLIELTDPKPGEIFLDIGCNDGTLLNRCEGRGLRRIGIDPSSEKFADRFQDDVEVIFDFFSEERLRSLIGDRSCKVTTAIAMFYDLDDPVGFMEQIASLLSDDGVFALELSYFPLFLENLTYDQICHEHVTYLAVRDFQRMAEKVGLRIIDIATNEVNGGSFYLTLCPREASYPSDTGVIESFLDKETKLDEPGTYERFRNRVLSHRDEVRHLLNLLKDSGEKVYGYGASTKGNIVLNFCEIGRDLIPFISDLNPEKDGLMTPGSSIPIISHEKMREDPPDYLFVFIWHFRKEVIRSERAFLENGGRMIFCLPRLHIVDASNCDRYLESDFTELAYSL